MAEIVNSRVMPQTPQMPPYHSSANNMLNSEDELVDLGRARMRVRDMVDDLAMHRVLATGCEDEGPLRLLQGKDPWATDDTLSRPRTVWDSLAMGAMDHGEE